YQSGKRRRMAPFFVSVVSKSGPFSGAKRCKGFYLPSGFGYKTTKVGKGAVWRLFLFQWYQKAGLSLVQNVARVFTCPAALVTKEK
ncbi:hypothetical protein, partial [uncultured Alcanivorax sp.]|uniref:hypothetical protein n=1 Tax=uncultured Alcanivorax sp. TaxID=191215 RepID=UPI0026055B33